jgi:hypothetical protein
MKERIAQRMSDLGLIKQSVFKALERYLKDNGFDPVSQPALSKVMTGRTKNPWFLPHLARVLECDPDWLRYGIKPATRTVTATEGSDYITIQQRTAIGNSYSDCSPGTKKLIARIIAAESSNKSSPQLIEALSKVLDIVAPEASNLDYIKLMEEIDGMDSKPDRQK